MVVRFFSLQRYYYNCSKCKMLFFLNYSAECWFILLRQSTERDKAFLDFTKSNNAFFIIISNIIPGVKQAVLGAFAKMRGRALTGGNPRLERARCRNQRPQVERSAGGDKSRSSSISQESVGAQPAGGAPPLLPLNVLLRYTVPAEGPRFAL